MTLGDVDPDPNSDVDPKYRHLVKKKNGAKITINGTDPNCTTRGWMI
ncbi:hypothetical protein [Paenibacillus sp. YN15]|nr:hypothetical protein [Paenibacillus sp. YN15]